MFMASAPMRLASRVSVALLKYSKPALSAHKYVSLSPNGLTRSFISSSRVAYTPEKTEIKQPEDNQASEKKPKKANNASEVASKAKKPKPQAKKENTVKKPDLLPPSPPATPYSLFVKDWYSKQPKSPSTEIGSQSKDIASEWHALSESDKQPYFDSYRALREEYVKERQEWFDNIDPAKLKEVNQYRAHKGKKQIRKPRHDPSGKPLTPFFLFAADYRSGQDEKLSAPEAGRRAGEAWRALSEAEKQQYLDRYKSEMDAWRALHAKSDSA